MIDLLLTDPRVDPSKYREPTPDDLVEPIPYDGTYTKADRARVLDRLIRGDRRILEASFPT
jgi:hypothetical protein